MITVENMLMAYASAYDAWLDPETERKNPTPEYAELIRRVVSAENAKLRELVEDMHAALQAFCDAQDVHGDNCPLWVERTDDCDLRGIERRMRELGIETGDGVS